MDTKGKIYFKNEPFMAVVEGRGDNPVKCTPIVYDGRDPSSAFGNECGAGILFEDGKIYSWGLWQPRNLIVSWRATEILRRLNVIKKHDFCAAYSAGCHRISDSDREKYVKPIIAKIGNQTYKEIMAMPVPETIIRAILDNQGQDFSPSLFPISYEVKAGTIKWRQEFADAGIENPDEVDARKFRQDKKISRFERLLVSYAKSQGLPRHCIRMDKVEKILLDLIEKGADEAYSDNIVVSMAGTAADFIASDFAKSMQLDHAGTHEAISCSARWLTLYILGKPRFFRRRAHLATLSDIKNKIVEPLLLRLLEEYFPAAKASSATTSAQ
ncbi:MAG: hypothetical protein Q8N22_01320 [bacterium]|nr:hypothetical protein [bacterium]